MFRYFICSNRCVFRFKCDDVRRSPGNIVSLPSNYYKVLLRTKSGSTGKAIKDCSADELISIGFWVEHKSYGQDIPRSICTKVADIEAKTGFTFFPQVSASVKQQNNPTQWGIN